MLPFADTPFPRATEKRSLLPHPAARPGDGYACHTHHRSPFNAQIPATAARPVCLSACSSAPALPRKTCNTITGCLDRLDGQAIASRRSNPRHRIGEHFTVNGIAGCNRVSPQGGTSSGSPASAAPPDGSAPELDSIEQAGSPPDGGLH